MDYADATLVALACAFACAQLTEIGRAARFDQSHSMEKTS
jgi:hypothetical protein